MYGNPEGFRPDSITVDPGPLGDILEGASRPGHFRGTLTVVAKLLGLTQPDLALFGEKDHQQLVLISRMVADLSMPVQVIGVPTVRDILIQALLDAPMFTVRWRWNAVCSLALRRFQGGRKTPPYLLRMQAEDLADAQRTAKLAAQRFERDLRACKKALGPSADLVQIERTGDYVCREVDVEPTPAEVLHRYYDLGRKL